MGELKVDTLKVLQDNFIFIVRDTDTATTAVVDPALAAPVVEFCKQGNLQIGIVINTHHHWDHVGGNLEIKQQTGCEVVGFEGDRERIPGITRFLKAGDSFTLGSCKADVLFIPGHTSGHIAYHFAREKILFCGDTLFSMGCGRLFEGTPTEMFHSLEKLSKLPPETLVYCTHEYTLSNARFALSLDPQSSSQKNNYATLEDRLKADGATVPTTIGYELEWNPFLKCKNPLEFAELRKRKDVWKDRG